MGAAKLPHGQMEVVNATPKGFWVALALSIWAHGVAKQSPWAMRVVCHPYASGMGVAELPPWPNGVVKATSKGFGVVLATFKGFEVASVLPIWAPGGGRTTPMGHESGLPPHGQMEVAEATP
jgi:hypothetical protein